MVAIYDGINDYRKKEYEVFGKPYRYDDFNSSTPNLGAVRFKLENKNGIPFVDDAGTILHLNADNISGSNWPSTVGGITAVKTGGVNGNAETPFYTNGLFNGVGYRKATTGYNPTGFWSIPYNASLEFTSTNETNFIIGFRTGDFSRTETLLSRYILASANHHCLINVSTTGTLTFKVGCDVADSIAQLTNLEPYTYYLMYFYWNGGTLQTFIRLDGSSFVFGNGAGNVVTDASTAWRIGNDAAAGANYALTSQIFEIWRSDTVMSLASYSRALRRFCGSQPTTGPDPSFQYRYTSANVFVNNNLWRVGNDLMRMNYYGLQIEESQVGQLLNNTFTSTINPATDWIVSTAGTTSVTQSTGGGAFSGIGGQRVEFVGDILGSTGSIFQSSIDNFAINSRLTLSIDYKSTTINGTPYYCVQNAADLRWYEEATDTWSIAQVYNPMPISGVLYRKIVTFSNTTSNGIMNITVSTGPTGSNVSQGFEVYHVQLDEGQIQRERLSSGLTRKTKDAEIYIFNNTIVNTTKGAITFNYSSENPGTLTSSSNRSVLGSFGPFVGVFASQGQVKFTDGGNTLTGSSAYTRLENDDYTITYDSGIPTMNMRSLSLGVNTTLGAFGGLAPGFCGIGQDGNLGVAIVNGYIKDFTTYNS